ncbi:MAG: glycerophosphodiester phosphodiesterase [Actinomycetota bacterium]|nr:glycerophosphodiester phosphodiesterase [Actinomycetota bacterium]
MPPEREPASPNYLSPARPRLFAHRGLALEAPENTLLAFAKALALGVRYLETDVHASADGVAMISHDPDLTRLTGREVRIDQLTAAELQKIDLGDGQTFTTLAAALHAFPEARFNIDIKAMAAAAPTVEVLRQARAENRVMVGSFSNARRLAVTTQLPDVATSVSSRGAVIATWAAAVGLRPLVARALRGSQAMQVPEKILGARTTSPRALAAFHAAGVEVHIWTINDAASMNRLLDAGVDGIMTDRADIAVEVFARR